MESAGSSQGPYEGVLPRRISLELEERGFISLGQAPLSPTRYEQHPILVEFTKHLRAGLDEVWQNRHGSRYKNVRVLLVHWEADDLGVLKEIDVLRHVFSDLYFYDVSQYAIPNHRPDWSVKRRVLDFVEDDFKDTLLIFYYAGHAFINTNRHDTPVWAANRYPNSASLPLGGIQSILEEAQCDVLLLYDTCHSADTAVSSARSTRGITEVIAACGFESVAAEVGEHSFTSALANILAMASDEQAISVSEIHNRLLARLKRWQSSPLTDSHGRFLRGLNGRVAMEVQRRRTPVYCNLTFQRAQRSIFLAPLRQRDLVEGRYRGPGPNSSPRETSLPLEHRPLGITGTTNPSGTNEESRPSSELLVTIKLADEIVNAQKLPDSDYWVEWLRNAPPEAGEIDINLKEPLISRGDHQNFHECPLHCRPSAKNSFFDTRNPKANDWDLLFKPELLKEAKLPYYEPSATLWSLRTRGDLFVSRIFFWLWMLLLVGPVLIICGFEVLTPYDVPRTVILGILLVFVLMSTELCVILSEVTRVQRHEIFWGIGAYCAVLCVFATLTEVRVYKVFILHVKTHILPDWAGGKSVFIKSSSYT